MDLQNALSVAAKDLETIRTKRTIMVYTIGFPIGLSVLFTLIVQNEMGSSIPDTYQLGLESLVYFFVVVAAILPSSIAAYSIVGEKIEKSLEPLLATPMTDDEILLGKEIAAFVPPILSTWLGASIFMVSADLITRPGLSYYYFPNGFADVSLFVLAPLAAVFGIEVAVILSSRVTDVRGVNQIAGLMWAPFVFIFLAAVTGTVTLSASFLLVVSLAVALIDLLLYFLSRATFRREEILTRWK